ncbi:hypothetical protein QVD17_20470 [Tagetes erecta]|uniref:Uncharacterized protein n=1 Tax=Tagetes erecta TaxID=13708 RepID=A0AAD8KSW7_TARER|nr:hypothetical protein QVD17_20470 [Tagetes erecta]
MEKRKREWTNENEEVSLAGVKKHGFGNPNSLSDSQLASSLANQSKRKREWSNEPHAASSLLATIGYT